MNVMIDLCIVPMGVGKSVSASVAACQTIIEAAGLRHELHAYGTTIEGEWDAVFAAVKQCHQTVHEQGAPRIFTVLKVGTRTDRPQSMADKIASVENHLADRKTD